MLEMLSDHNFPQIMHLQDDESILKVYHHHPTTFFIRGIKIGIVSLPFFFFAWLFSVMLTPAQMAMIYGIITALFALLIAYDLILFSLDRLVITNKRIVHIDWKSAFQRSENETELMDIQDITTEEAGILAFISLFDFGLFKLETASTKTSIIFTDAPDPEGIKHFIYHLHIKPTRIGGASLLTEADDKARQTVDEEAATSRRQ